MSSSNEGRRAGIFLAVFSSLSLAFNIFLTFFRIQADDIHNHANPIEAAKKDEKDSKQGKLVFNRAVSLRDSWAKILKHNRM